MLNRSIKARYWRIVRACLVELFHFSNHAAEAKVRELRADLSSMPVNEADPFARELIYHEEALNIAKELAGSSVRRVDDVWPGYRQILERDQIMQLAKTRKSPRAVQEKSGLRQVKESMAAAAAR